MCHRHVLSPRRQFLQRFCPQVSYLEPEGLPKTQSLTKITPQMNIKATHESSRNTSLLAG
jgi:hypothetical protein